MIVVPYHNQLTLRNVPWVSAALGLLCVLVFFAQLRDGTLMDQALGRYAQSSLAKIEIERYRQWLFYKNDLASHEQLKELGAVPPTEQDLRRGALLIQADAQFLPLLRSGQIIKQEDPIYRQWREDRIKFEQLLKRTLLHKLQLRANSGQLWRLLTYAFSHTHLLALLINLPLLLVAGAFVERALGRSRFSIAAFLIIVAAGIVHLWIERTPLVGASGLTAAMALMTGLLYRNRLVPTLLTVGIRRIRLHVRPIFLVPVGILLGLGQAALGPDEVAWASYTHLMTSLAVGALLVRFLKPREKTGMNRTFNGLYTGVFEETPEERNVQRRQELARQAQEAANRMDTRRAVRLYKDLVEDSPTHTGYLSSYFNVALMSKDPEPLTDAALRILGIYNKNAASALRKVYLQISQPNVLKVLPVDEQLRLVRRLVRVREDTTALKVLDGLLASPQLRQLYGRQIADCLLALFTTYMRYGLRQQADSVRKRLKKHFPQPDNIGGLPPNTRTATHAPSTMHRTPPSTSGGPSTLLIDLSGR